jgi:ribosomal protein S12 methylthiotransferase accessory factor YcaO
MSAGNTVEEALSQSISEICEHMVSNDFLISEHDKYYRIDPLTLNNELQDKIKNIENAGSKLLIFDLSYIISGKHFGMLYYSFLFVYLCSY